VHAKAGLVPAFVIMRRRMLPQGAEYTDRMTPRLLALDTATERVAVALVVGERHWSAEEEGGARASQRILPMAFELLAQAGLAARSLDAVAFGRGPGAFTGLRTACSVAQGLALGVGCPVLPIDSLLLVADDARAQAGGDDWWIAVDARMDEAYAGSYRWRDGGWQTARESALWTLPALADAWRTDPPSRIAGNAVATFGERLPAAGALRQDTTRDRGAALARLASQAWARGAAIDAALALPLYLRDKVALTTAERAAARASA
jgi:tRNA threonylcarbamoyladenosine biosynthesis protein TsaB